MDTQTTRRVLIGAAGLASVALIAPAVAAMPLTPAPSKVEAAWGDWKAGMAFANASERDCPANFWDHMGALEATICTSTETGSRVAEVRLWLAMTYAFSSAEEHAAIYREDADWLIANGDDPEFSTSMALAAIVALRGETRA